ncbi:signal recognition particle protein [Alicyclobacillus acidoterrestris]|uniref:Signal recognition particle protein n=1 Tax=Alicyclobacillus acidoterrestris (strain ATCC 49025 / DSM 3922 / CIP 106132 / NCIMB 13137 / GD3B) TaxID=1356854 RepID=T0DQ44_ALIAG|nr:signal recognition particle protein [Alicyclobacillus acidoterrestris]EPZ51591.1 signal recognition particle protein Srp54 [Alicyclobacillus acidoterrestris ATCC 49025]UNO50648.1 signal recognition particle protein [Alicyclobacillus acidoterrestris]
MLEGLSSSLQKAMGRLRGKGKLSEADVAEAMREVRLALLAADVNVKVVRDFVERVRERAVGQDVQKSLTPGQQVVRIVYEELTELMGGSQARIQMASKPPTVIMLVGLQGAGKTTAIAKLALSFRQHQHRPLMIAADVYRPAAIDQLHVLGKQVDIPVFDMGTDTSPVEIVRQGMQEAERQGADVVLVDTAGRLHIDEDLMAELDDIKSAVEPNEVLLVVDAMTGQDAVHVAETFHRRLDVTGVILTKLDGDARGGAALTVRAVTGCPIKYVGLGEKIEPLEPFHPDRLASRILGMGDVLSLIERAQERIDLEKAKEMEERMRSSTFSLNDFQEMFRQVRNLGPLDQVLKMIPGMNKLKGIENVDLNDKRFLRMDAIISSMTAAERLDPSVMNASRRRRIANGSGTTVREVNQLLNQFEQTQQMMKRMSGMGKKMGRRSAMNAIKSMGGLGALGGMKDASQLADLEESLTSKGTSHAPRQRHHRAKKKRK